ncbi:MAG: type I restriction enzyme HsdR N-terminal domain-containing protein [Chlamydiia bacterium]|nr:type I restriction enzyme HsdR N-terminal domain-containing protein [Chlamydiia bacterium]
MGSSPQSSELFDPIRQKWVEALPEERVRQALLTRLIQDLGYPMETLMVEKEMREVPHIQGKDLPSRRLDILCLASQSLPSLLLIECKAIPLKEAMLAQVRGYNAFIGAPVICLANQTTCILEGASGNALPSYQQLMQGS